MRINHYQNNTSRLTSPLQRIEDGSYIEVDWDTAIKEISQSLKEISAKYGADKIFYYGGGGQGNHLGGAHSTATRQAYGITRKSNALAQEKINILAISTSEIKISVLISEMHTQRAVKVLHKIFDLG